MSPKPTTLLTLLHCISIAISVHISCPNVPAQSQPAANTANQFLSDAEINALSLDSSCFAMDMRLNVENILPDPSYISRQTNTDIIQSALQKTLSDNNMNGISVNAADIAAHEWSVNNECPQKKDETVSKFHFDHESVPYTAICDEKTLKLVGQSFECVIKTPESIAYVFNTDSITTTIAVTGMNMVMQATIINSTNNIVATSDTKTFMLTNSANPTEMLFGFAKPIMLTANTTYMISVRVTDGSQIELVSVPQMPALATNAHPSACHLANVLADDPHMQFAIRALCHDLTVQQRHTFEHVFYQQHSTQNYIGNIAPEPPVRRRRRQLLDSCGTCGRRWKNCCRGYYCKRYDNGKHKCKKDDTQSNNDAVSRQKSLHMVYSNATDILIANDLIYTNYDQCMAISQETFRLFSVGGADRMNGAAKDRLAIYQIHDNIQSAWLLQPEGRIDRARYGAMCYFYADPEGAQYLIVINGMNSRNDMNTNAWFNDITFLPIDANGAVVYQPPSASLKYNVIDMTPAVSPNDELFLFGGRDALNAVNYIQSIDLMQLLDPNNGGTEFITTEIMEPMLFNRVSPFVDFVRLEDKTCVMIFGGQNYVNGQWIDIETYPNHKLQLYCNDNVFKLHYASSPYDHHFTAFDKAHLKSVDSFENIKATDNIFMSDYNFANNDILYDFGVTFKVCMDSGANAQMTNVLNLFDKDSLAQNILSESQRRFKGWSDGFGAIDISEIHILKAVESVAANDCIGLTESVCESVVIASSNGAVNGDQECAYNVQTNGCYRTQRIPAGSNNGNLDNGPKYVAVDSVKRAKVYGIVATIIGVIAALLLVIIGASVYVYKKRKTKDYTVAMELDMVETENVNINTNDLN